MQCISSTAQPGCKSEYNKIKYQENKKRTVLQDHDSTKRAHDVQSRSTCMCVTGNIHGVSVNPELASSPVLYITV